MPVRERAAIAPDLMHSEGMNHVMSQRYYVFGGVFADTGWSQVTAGTAELYGPFDSLDAAEEVWRGRAFATVDDAHARFQVVKEADLPGFFDRVPDDKVICDRATIERLIALRGK